MFYLEENVLHLFGKKKTKQTLVESSLRSPKNMQHLKKRMLYLTLTSYWEVKRKTYFWSLKFFFKDKTVFQQLVT